MPYVSVCASTVHLKLSLSGISLQLVLTGGAPV